MKFDFSDISFGEISVFEGSDKKCTESADQSDHPTCRDIACYVPTGGKRNGAEKYVDTFLNSSPKESQKRDSINEFYSDLAAPSTKRTLAINKNTVDRHGRT